MTSQSQPPRLILHLGLGAFHRAHQAWFTERMNQQLLERGELPWHIVAFTGRRPDAAVALSAQNNRFTLLARDEDGDHPEVVTSIIESRSGDDASRWRELMSVVPVVTVTVTEPAYGVVSGAELVEELRALHDARLPVSAIGRLVDGLRARSQGGAGPLAVVACDNLDRNGEVLAASVVALAGQADPQLASWISANVSFVSSVVDRITPALPDDSGIELDGRADRCAVVTEVPAAWVLSGAFPAGRPPWELAGALFVDDLLPYEHRKLWLLNAGHTLLASLGQLRGKTTVSAAVADPVCLAALQRLWDNAGEVLPFTVAQLVAERAVLLQRFGNPGIQHRLDQIFRDSELKLSFRVVPVITERLAAGLPPGDGELTALAAWARLNREPVAAALHRLAPELVRSAAVCSRLAEIDRQLSTEGVIS